MAIPANVTTKTVQGRYIDLQGNPIAGQVKFTIVPVLVNSDDDSIIIPSTVTVDLDAQGGFAVVLPVTDDPDLDPTNFTYRVEEAFPRGRTYDIQVPTSSTSPINLADIVPAVASSGSYANFVLLSDFNALASRVTAAESDINAVELALPAAEAEVAGLQARAATAASAAFAVQADVQGILSRADAALATAQSAESTASLSLTTAQAAGSGGLSPFLLGGA